MSTAESDAESPSSPSRDNLLPSKVRLLLVYRQYMSVANKRKRLRACVYLQCSSYKAPANALQRQYTFINKKALSHRVVEPVTDTLSP